MLSQDIKPNRIEQAKYGVRDLLPLLKGDRIGLIAFAGDSFLECPLTVDYGAFKMSLNDVRVGMIPRGGTAIGESLRTAIKSFDTNTAADRVVFLITDGEDHESDPLQIVPELKQRGIRVFAIGVGSAEGDLIPVTDDEGHTLFLKDSEGQVVKSKLNESSLSQLALQTGGVYVRAAQGDLGLDRILNEQLSKLKREQSESKVVQLFEDRFPWFLGTALALLLIEASLGERRRMVEAQR